MSEYEMAYGEGKKGGLEVEKAVKLYNLVLHSVTKSITNKLIS